MFCFQTAKRLVTVFLLNYKEIVKQLYEVASAPCNSQTLNEKVNDMLAWVNIDFSDLSLRLEGPLCVNKSSTDSLVKIDLGIEVKGRQIRGMT